MENDAIPCDSPPAYYASKIARIFTCMNMSLPIGSMYGIYANIWGILMGSMLPYIAYMDPMGYGVNDSGKCIVGWWFRELPMHPWPAHSLRLSSADRIRIVAGTVDCYVWGLGQDAFPCRDSHIPWNIEIYDIYRIHQLNAQQTRVFLYSSRRWCVYHWRKRRMGGYCINHQSLKIAGTSLYPSEFQSLRLDHKRQTFAKHGRLADSSHEYGCKHVHIHSHPTE